MRPALLLVLLPLSMYADGGKLVLHAEAAGVTISLFADPFPVRAAQPCDFSVLIQRGNEPVLDGLVTLRMRDTSVQLTHQAATNKLLFAATVTLPDPGKVPFTVLYDRAQVSGQLVVDPESPQAASYWPYFAAVPVLIALFTLNRYLKRRRESVTSA